MTSTRQRREHLIDSEQRVAMNDNEQYKGGQRNDNVNGKRKMSSSQSHIHMRGWKVCAWQEINGGELSLVVSGLVPELLVFPR